MAQCIFCEIAAGRIAAPVVFEDEDTLAFLDHRPLFPGHSLLIPKVHFDTLIDLPGEQSDRLFRNARILCAAMESAMGAEGTFVAVNNRVSQSVPHVHIHVVPRRKKDGLKGFFWPRRSYSDESEVESVRNLLHAATNRLKTPSLH